MPNSSSPRSAQPRAPSTWSRIQAILRRREVGREREARAPLEAVGVAVGAIRSTISWCGCPARRWRCGWAFRSPRSQTIAVSRWLVIPTPAMSCRVRFALPSASADHLPGVLPDLGGVVLDPARLREVLLVLELPVARPACPRGRTRSHGWRSCPGRWRGRARRSCRRVSRHRGRARNRPVAGQPEHEVEFGDDVRSTASAPAEPAIARP